MGKTDGVVRGGRVGGDAGEGTCSGKVTKERA